MDLFVSIGPREFEVVVCKRVIEVVSVSLEGNTMLDELKTVLADVLVCRPVRIPSFVLLGSKFVVERDDVSLVRDDVLVMSVALFWFVT